MPHCFLTTSAHTVPSSTPHRDLGIRLAAKSDPVDVEHATLLWGETGAAQLNAWQQWDEIHSTHAVCRENGRGRACTLGLLIWVNAAQESVPAVRSPGVLATYFKNPTPVPSSPEYTVLRSGSTNGSSQLIRPCRTQSD